MFTYKRTGGSHLKLIKNCVLRNFGIICLNVLVIGYLFFGEKTLKISFAAPTTAGTIERSQEILQQDNVLRQKIEQKERFFVKKIILKGASKLSEEEINNIIVSSQGGLMTKKDIQQIIDSLKSAYEKKGINPDRIKITYKLKKSGILEIDLKESTH